jgi:osmotically-inducible protein OsmY
MFPAQIAKTNPDEFSRCEELELKTEQGKNLSLSQKTDAAIKESINNSLWKDEVLRAIEYDEFAIYVKEGVVYLNGHIVSASSQKRIETAIRAISGVQALQNNLVLDDNLTPEVAGSLSALEHTYDCKFFTGASHGIISLNGVVIGENVKSLAERCVASNPNVRGVINNVRVSGAAMRLPEEPFLQPTIGELIYFLDGVSGVVKQVIMNPNNRRVIAMTVWGQFASQPQDSGSLHYGEPRSPGQLIVLLMDTVRYLTRNSGFLHIKSTETERYKDFDPASFFTPPVDWRPPYPYCRADVLIPVEYQTEKIQPTRPPEQYPVEEIVPGTSFTDTEQLFASETPES